MPAQTPESHLTGENAAYLEALAANGRGVPGPTLPAASLFSAVAAASAGSVDVAAIDRQGKVVRLINAYRVQGHWAAMIDPLGVGGREAISGKLPTVHPELDPAFYGFSEADMDAEVFTSPLIGMPARAKLREIIERLRQSYCGTVGVEFMNMLDLDEKRWIQDRFERIANLPPIPRETQIRMLEMLTRAEGLERFLHTKFLGNKRFSVEGGESVIALLDLLISEAGRMGVREAVIGMAHRGRLNVLVNILGKPPRDLLAEFKGFHHDDGDPDLTGDVKYHLGYSSDRQLPGGPMHLSLAFNPSHLEFVNPVVEGRVRAKMDRSGDTVGHTILPLLIHGDAAFAGQGINQEVLNLSGLQGYSTGGTVHVVINNQVGFTTSPHDARSTPYCTAIARMLGVPIFHVNGEDAETVARIVTLAMEYRQTFHRDVVIDLYCFRKWGHNEQDEPAYTQPEMYRRIAAHPGVREHYLASLISRGVLTREHAVTMEAGFRDELDAALNAGPLPEVARAPSALSGLWAGFHSSAPDNADTRVPIDTLRALLLGLNAVPEGFQLNRKILSLLKAREEQAAGKRPLDWAAGELLAYATLVTGAGPAGATASTASRSRVRLSGQDCKRGTFSHRHAVFVDQQTGAQHAPLAHLSADQAPFDVYNSLLSESGVLGFEFGYSLDYPDALVIWEAQFGDFANGAQVIIDNFLVSSHAKWNRLSGLTLMLPHGYEGQGPEHSSARIERFLQLAAQNNIQVANCTNPAQIFHLLRRQMLRTVRDPLVIFTPKSLLRAPQAVSSLEDLATGGFQRVIPDSASGMKRVVFCSGKVYYDLVNARSSRTDAGTPCDVAIVRVEQIYPFPLSEIQAEIARNPGAELVWCQEESKNMGAWSFVALECLEAGIRLRYAGRAASASTATGFAERHKAEQEALVQDALG